MLVHSFYKYKTGALFGFFKEGYIDKWLGRLEKLVFDNPIVP